MLVGVYAIGVFGILASGDSSDGDAGGFSCDLVVRGIAPVSDGTVWAGVLAVTNNNSYDKVLLLDSDGSELASYDIGNGSVDNAVRAVALAADASDDVYVGGDFPGGILRLNNDGSLDPGFNVVGAGFNGRVTSIAPQADGTLYVGGYFSEYNNIPVSGLVRLLNDGTRDTLNFVAVGVTNVESVALASDGTTDLYSGGTGLSLLERWNSNGSPDTVVFNPIIGPVHTIAPVPVPSGDIYVGGNFTGRIIRFNSNGTPDAAFDVDTGFDTDVLSVELAAAGTLYVGGSFTSYQGVDANGILRLGADGSRDGGFLVGNGFINSNSSSPAVTSVAETTDGFFDVFVGGGFSDYDGTPVNGIARLDSDGSLDSGFDVRIAVNGGTCSSNSISD
jgi:hypothetical protein